MSKWWKETSIYQIYPRSFCDSNGDGVGDIRGIISKIDYLAELGVETIWLSPVYESPHEDHGYDISDYCSIHHEYGTMEDVDEMILKMHEKGLKVVFDMVMNHTSHKHQWFLDSASRQNGKDDWYIWQDGKKTCTGALGPPNNWRSMIGPNGWIWHEERQQYYFSSFLSFQPDLNYRNPEVKNAMLKVVKFWMDKGVDGFRLDIFNAVFKDSSFDDNPFSWRIAPSHEEEDGFFQSKVNTINHPDTLKFARELRHFVDNAAEHQKERFLVGEVIGRPHILKSYIGEPHDPGLNLVFMFETLDFTFSASYFESIIRKFENHYPEPDYKPVLVFSNHDIRRTMYRVGESVPKVKVVALLQLTLRGVPCLYYGDEIGMTEGTIPLREGEDPVAKLFSRFVPQMLYDSWLLAGVSMNRDNCRTPMQWHEDHEEHWKFPWLPVNPDVKHVNVNTQNEDPESILHLYKRLLQFRKSEPAIYRGVIQLPESINQLKNILCYERYDTETKNRIFVCINFGAGKFTLDSSSLTTEKLDIALSTDRRNTMVDEKTKLLGHHVQLFGNSGVILREMSE